MRLLKIWRINQSTLFTMKYY